MKESNYGSRFKDGFAQAALTELTDQSITAGALERTSPSTNLILALQRLLPKFQGVPPPAAKEWQLFLLQVRKFDTNQKGELRSADA